MSFRAKHLRGHLKQFFWGLGLGNVVEGVKGIRRHKGMLRGQGATMGLKYFQVGANRGFVSLRKGAQYEANRV